MNRFNSFYYLTELSDAAIKKVVSKFVDQGNDEGEVIGLVNQFNDLSLKNKITKTDIFNLTFDQLKELVQQSSTKVSRSEKEKLIKDNETEYVFENDKVLVVSPKTHKSSCKYGANTKWCTTGQDDEHWHTYQEQQIKLYYILPKDGLDKVAVAVYPDKRKEQFYANDSSMDKNELDTIIQHYTIPNDLFKPKNSKEIVESIVMALRYKVNEDGSYDVDDNVFIDQKGIEEIPIKFNRVNGDFWCYGNELRTLKNSPRYVKGNFLCSHNNLFTLEGSPEEVGGKFECQFNMFKTLKGLTQKIGGDFNCSYTEKMESLEGSPEISNGDFNCTSCDLKTLKGAPKEVKGDFRCQNNLLTSLEGAPKKVGGDFIIRGNYSKMFRQEDVRQVSDVKGAIFAN